MIAACDPEELFKLVGVDPNKEQQIDDQSFQALAREVITRYEGGAKSIAQVIALRAESASSGQDGSRPQEAEVKRIRQTKSLSHP